MDIKVLCGLSRYVSLKEICSIHWSICIKLLYLIQEAHTDALGKRTTGISCVTKGHTFLIKISGYVQEIAKFCTSHD